MVTEFVSSEGILRRDDRTRKYTEFDDAQRPVGVQIFGADAEAMAESAKKIIDWKQPDFIDINFGCPVNKVVSKNGGSSLLRDCPALTHVAATIAKAVPIPVTAKIRIGWDQNSINALRVVHLLEDCGIAAVTIHGRTAEQSYSGSADWDLVTKVANELTIPVLGSGDCVEPEHVLERMAAGVSGVLVGRGVLRNPWILAQAADLAAGRPPRTVTLRERGEFLSTYVEMLLNERVNEGQGFRHFAPGMDAAAGPARGRERWVINKVRALCAWYSKGLEGGSQLRTRVNAAASLGELREIVDEFFFGVAIAS